VVPLKAFFQIGYGIGDVFVRGLVKIPPLVGLYNFAGSLD
jgi:hypothetical protein